MMLDIETYRGLFVNADSNLLTVLFSCVRRDPETTCGELEDSLFLVAGSC